MKRYIKATLTVDIDTHLFDGTPFKCDTTISYYNDFLNSTDLKYMQNHKNRTGEIVMMTPMEYFQECAKLFNTSVDALIDQRSDSSTVQYEEDMRNGDKFPLCYIDYTHGQEGLHRMLAAGNVFGWDKKFPVLVVTAFDQALEELNNDIYNCARFIKFGTFDDVCRQAVDDYVEFNTAIPTDFEKSFRNAVISTADRFEDGYDIDVAVKLVEDNGKHEANVYLTRFGVYEIPQDDLADPYIIGLDYFYDFGEDKVIPESDWVDELSADIIDDAVANGVDLNDYDAILDYFFKNN